MVNKITWINLINIKLAGTYPLNPKTMKLAIKLWNKELQPDELPPVRVQQDENGVYWLKDGRHRYVALKMCGYTKIKAKVSCPKYNFSENK